MFPVLNIANIVSIPLYGLIFLIGYFIVAFALRPAAKSHGLQTMDGFCAHLFAGIGVFIGAKIMYCITVLPTVVPYYTNISHLPALLSYFKSNPIGFLSTFLSYCFGGLVFYGGLIGGVLGIVSYCLAFKVPFTPYLEMYAPAIPFMHAFGRIGCFCAGCCYGIEYHGPFAVTFPYNEYVPELSEVPRFPVQLTEALLNFIVAGILFYLYKKRTTKKGVLLGIYVCYYTVARFLLEFLRGDEIRGGIGSVSTSQIISILLIPIGIWLVSGGVERLLNRRHQREYVSTKDASL